MTKEYIKGLQASNKKLACIPADQKITEYWISQLNVPNIKFVEILGFADSYENTCYAAFEVPVEMTKDEFLKALNVDCSPFILGPNGALVWNRVS